jgi:hypothetical protein
MNGIPVPQQAQKQPVPAVLQLSPTNATYEHIVALMQNAQTAQPLIMAASAGQVPQHIIDHVKQYVQANMPILSGMQPPQGGKSSFRPCFPPFFLSALLLSAAETGFL